MGIDFDHEAVSGRVIRLMAVSASFGFVGGVVLVTLVL